MPVTAAVSAAATLGGAAIASSGAQSAAKTQANAANQATAVQQQMFQQTRNSLQPFISAGSGAQSSLSALLGTNQSGPAPTAGAPNWSAYLSSNPDVNTRAQQLVADGTIGPNGQWATPQDWAAYQYGNTGQSEGRALPTYSAADVSAAANPGAGQEAALEALPGYQFTRDQGIASVNRVLGSTGQTGAQAKGIARFVTGLADSTYNSQVQNLQNNVNSGENAAAGTGNIGASYASNIGNNIVGAGTAGAAGQIGAANAASGALGQIPSYLLANQILGNGGSSSAGIYGVAPTAAGNAAVEGLY